MPTMTLRADPVDPPEGGGGDGGEGGGAHASDLSKPRCTPPSPSALPPPSSPMPEPAVEAEADAVDEVEAEAVDEAEKEADEEEEEKADDNPRKRPRLSDGGEGDDPAPASRAPISFATLLAKEVVRAGDGASAEGSEEESAEETDAFERHRFSPSRVSVFRPDRAPKRDGKVPESRRFSSSRPPSLRPDREPERLSGKASENRRFSSSGASSLRPVREPERRFEILDDWFSGTGRAIDAETGEAVEDYKVYAAKVGVDPTWFAERIVERSVAGRREREAEAAETRGEKESGQGMRGRGRKRPLEDMGEEDAAECGPTARVRVGSNIAGASETSIGCGRNCDVPLQEIVARLSSLEQSVAQIQALFQPGLVSTGGVSGTQRAVPNNGHITRATASEYDGHSTRATAWEDDGGRNDARVGIERQGAMRHPTKGDGMMPTKADPRPANLRNGINSLDEVWREYKFGLDGNKPAELFTHQERHGQGQALQKQYYRREHIWRCIDRLVRVGCTSEEVIKKIKQVYGHGTSLRDLNEMIRKDKKKSDKTGFHPGFDEILAPSKQHATKSSESMGGHGGGADPRPANLRNGINSLDELWREYKFGLDGNKPAELFTPQERNGQGQALQRQYYRREKIWDCIDHLIRGGCTPEQAFVKIQQVYGHDHCTSIRNLNAMIRKDKKKYPKTGFHPGFDEILAPSEQHPGNSSASTSPQAVQTQLEDL